MTKIKRLKGWVYDFDRDAEKFLKEVNEIIEQARGEILVDIESAEESLDPDEHSQNNSKVIAKLYQQYHRVKGYKGKQILSALKKYFKDAFKDD